MKLKDLKIAVLHIIRDHIRSIVNANTGKPDVGDKLVFIFIPIAVSAALVYVGNVLNDRSVGILIQALTLFIGLFFNLLVLIFDQVRKSHGRTRKLKLIKEMNASISFTIVLAIIAFLLILINLFQNYWIQLFAEPVIFFVLTEIMMTLLMVLKRMYAIFDDEHDEVSKSPSNRE